MVCHLPGKSYVLKLRHTASERQIQTGRKPPRMGGPTYKEAKKQASRQSPTPCVLFFQTIDLPQHLAQGPFCIITTIRAREQKNNCRPLTGLSIRQSTRDNPSSNHPLLAHWTFFATNNDLNYYRVPVPSGDRHLGQWASISDSGASLPQRFIRWRRLHGSLYKFGKAKLHGGNT